MFPNFSLSWLLKQYQLLARDRSCKSANYATKCVKKHQLLKFFYSFFPFGLAVNQVSSMSAVNCCLVSILGLSLWYKLVMSKLATYIHHSSLEERVHYVYPQFANALTEKKQWKTLFKALYIKQSKNGWFRVTHRSYLFKPTMWKSFLTMSHSSNEANIKIL